MRIFGLYLKEKRNPIILILLFAIIIEVVTVLYGADQMPVLYAFELYITILLIYSVVDFIRFRAKIDTLEKHLVNQTINELHLPETNSPLELKYQEIIEEQLCEKKQIIQKNMAATTDLKDYYAMWAHQIKTPIAATNLILQVLSEEPEKLDVRELKEELFKIDFYTDAVMNYLRLEDTSSDFTFRDCLAEEVVNKAVKKFSGQFIRKKISLQVECKDMIIYTDEKWLGFILEQLLSNSLKYTSNNGKINISTVQSGNSNMIIVGDNGIGIRQEDLPMIMERGYTGYNGRMDKQSTGIGLYLCKKAADKLGARLIFDSELGRGTKVCIEFVQKKLKYE